MRSHVCHIGLIDLNGKIHSVSFTPGLNVVTGRSSTGKSALIEIFDTCFGSSDFTVPEGIITQSADIFFLVIKIRDTTLVIGRKVQAKYIFLNQDNASGVESNAEVLNKEYFTQDKFYPLESFKKELGRFLGITVSDTDISSQSRIYRGQKSPAPSVRSMMSFMLQHQNLIANKHAVFYRFDEFRKRQQAVEHFCIFTGFVDQDYFLRMQTLNEAKAEIKRLEALIPKLDDIRFEAKDKLTKALHQFAVIAGYNIIEKDVDEIVKKPKSVLKEVRDAKVSIQSLSDEYIKIRGALEEDSAVKTAELRKLQRKFKDVESSIKYAKDYSARADSILIPTEAHLSVSLCPFCDSRNNNLEDEANKLAAAVEWLNNELSKSSYLMESFEGNLREAEKAIDIKRDEIRSIAVRLKDLEDQIKAMEGGRPTYELAIKQKVTIELILETLSAGGNEEVKAKLKDLYKQVENINSYLKTKYHLSQQMDDAEKCISNFMNDIGKDLEFEDSYQPINLRLSLETFDLWHYKEDEERKIFLRSMGSGANWLYCHISLFLGMHRYFCSLGDHCLIPSILFFDQPSQVYFPSELDSEEKFDADLIAAKEGSKRKRSVDADIEAVTNLFDQMINFCENTERETGVMPQIIVTDHADNLPIKGRNFNDYVRARWRDRGFIDNV